MSKPKGRVQVAPMMDKTEELMSQLRLETDATRDNSEGCSVCKTFVSGLYNLYDGIKKNHDISILEIRWTFKDRVPSLSNLSAAARRGCDWLTDSLGPYPLDPKPQLHVLGSNDVDPFSSGHVEQLRRAVEGCIQDHLSCPDSVEAPAPSRLLKVMSGEYVKLEPTKGKRVKYAALSYCWGTPRQGVDDYRTLEKNYEARKTGFRLDELPETLRDVVQVTRRLEIPYIWIDALCIIQDNTADWEAEATQMMYYYENAYLTIAPVLSDSVYAGMRNGGGEPPFCRSFPGPWNRDNNPDLILADKGSKYYDGTIFYSTWNQRGWTYQEMLNSARILFVFSHSITLRCRTGSWDSLQGWHSGSSQGGEIFLPVLLNGGTKTTVFDLDPHDEWCQVVDNFTRRKLTMPKDRWVAFSGIAQRFSRNFSKEIVAGLWKERLLEELVSWLPPLPLPVWRPDDPASSSVNGGNKKATFPSWTWVGADWSGVDDGIVCSFTKVDRVREPRAEIRSIINENDVRSVKLEIFGSVLSKGAILTLLHPPRRSAPLLRWSEEKVLFDHCRCPSPHHASQWMCELDSHGIISSLGPMVSALLIGVGWSDNIRTEDWYFLLVQPTGNSHARGEEYRRIGVMAIEDGEMNTVYKSIKDQLVSGSGKRGIVLV
ncbi:hypothetical protein VTH82DRAFT_6735 [Thermothelomyces myriococcoides]